MCTNSNHPVNDSEINLESLFEYLKKRYPDRVIEYNEFLLKDLHATLNMYSGDSIKTISELDRALYRTKKAVEKLERDFPPNAPEKLYTATAIVSLSIWLLENDILLTKTPYFLNRGLTLEKLREYQDLILPETNGC